MRRILLVLVALVLAGCSSTAPKAIAPGPSKVDVGSKDLVALKKQTDVPNCPKAPGVPVAGGLPSVTLACLGGGRSVDVADLRGPMIVNFWASWCGDCRKELPALAAYARSHPGVKVLGIDYSDVQPGAALQLAQKSKVGYPLIADPGQYLDAKSPLPHIPGLPITVFLDASGKLVGKQAGAMLTTSDVAAAAKKYLGVSG